MVAITQGLGLDGEIAKKVSIDNFFDLLITFCLINFDPQFLYHVSQTLLTLENIKNQKAKNKN